MIIVTGAAGFIGSCLVQQLNATGQTNLVLVDDFSRADKNRNFEGKSYLQKVDRAQFVDWFRANASQVDLIYHLGARTDTTEKSVEIFDHLNLNYTKSIWTICAEAGIPLVYASSAATYGLGEFGYVDTHEIVDQLKPLNPYGDSKNDFDKWALQQPTQPPSWAGLKFFNVYGPNEYHKGRMASVVFHAVRQIKATGGMKLFRSHREDVADGYQSRDFVYVKDVVKVCQFLGENRATVSNGLYNLGTGTARPFIDLVTATFDAMGIEPAISFIDTPADIRGTYQYFTEADMSKLRTAGYTADFSSLEEGIQDYVQQYLLDEKLF